MNRKGFISTILPLGLAAGGFVKPTAGKMMHETELNCVVPPYLQKGDTVGITCMAGFITKDEIIPAISKLKEWGYQVKIGETIGKRDYSFGGTAEERLADLQRMLDDRDIKAIISARGGYGAVSIIDRLTFEKFIRHPKWIIGFSDITVLHSHINRHCNIASIHSKMCNSFPSDWNLAEQVQRDTIESIHDCLSGKKMDYEIEPNANNKPGNTSGQLVGGNLKILETLAGSSSDINTKNKILFVEDTGEYLYSIDRMFWNLKRSGKLAHLKGLLIGGFKVKPDDPGEEFGRTLEQIVLEKVKEYSYPVCFNFPVGHQRNNYAVKCGMMHTLQVSDTQILLKEI